MDLLKIFDAYSIKARLFPAVIATAPALAALSLLISWKSFGLSAAIISAGMAVLLYAASDLARAGGKRVERKITIERGGMPSITIFRPQDSVFENGVKERYKDFLSQRMGVKRADEGDRVAAEAFYAQCGIWLRQNTRDVKRFPLLFSENITYGFRRNLLGLKAFGLTLNVVVLIICAVVLYNLSWSIENSMGTKVAAVLSVAAIHGAYMLFAVSEDTVWDASNSYARELILSCESFITHPEAVKKTRPRKAAVSSAIPSPPPGSP